MAYKEGSTVWLKPKKVKAKYHIDLKDKPFVSYFNEQGDLRTWEIFFDDVEDYNHQDRPTLKKGDVIKFENYSKYLFVIMKVRNYNADVLCISDSEDQIWTKGKEYSNLIISDAKKVNL